MKYIQRLYMNDNRVDKEGENLVCEIGEKGLIMAVDGSSTDTGVSIISKSGKVLGSILYTREKNESVVSYKTAMKANVYEILKRLDIEGVYYEEPFLGFVQSSLTLMAIRGFIAEIREEHISELSHIEYIEINNMRWKKIFLHPNKVSGDSRVQKNDVKVMMNKHLPKTTGISQDEVDSIAIGMVVALYRKKNKVEELKSKKKPNKFAYEVEFIGADDDDGFSDVFYDMYRGPKVLRDRGIIFRELAVKESFEKAVFSELCEKDCILVLKYKSSQQGNITLKHRIGELASEYKYIYAMVWRKARKVF